MFALSDENKSLKAKTAVAPGTNLGFVITYNDTGTINAEKGNRTIDGEIDQNLSVILDPPQERLIRDIRSVTISNDDNSEHTVYVYYSNSGNDRKLMQAKLLPEEILQFEWDTGWRIYDANGYRKEADSSTRIHQVSNPGAVLTDIYTVPAGKKAKIKITICNRANANRTFRIAISPGVAVQDSHYIWYNHTLTGGETEETSREYDLTAGDIIRVYGQDNGISFTVNGIEHE